MTTTETAPATADGFPRELLAQPPSARLAYFAAKVVAHPRLTEAHQATLDALRAPAMASLVLVVGPTGVGKTTLRLRVERQLVEAALPELARDPGRVPVVGVEAVAPESGQFNWKDYYTRALAALDEPLIAHKIDPAAAARSSSACASAVSPPSSSTRPSTASGWRAAGACSTRWTRSSRWPR